MAFEVQRTIHGMVITVGGKPISSGAWGDHEIDFQIRALKNDLDRAARVMKREAKEKRPLGLETND